MDSTIPPRLVTSFLVLLFCLAAWLRNGDVKPAHMVTEVVSIAMVNPRAAQPMAAGEPAADVMQLAASGSGSSPRMEPTFEPSVAPPAGSSARPQAAVRPAPARALPAARTPTQVAHATSGRKRAAGGKGTPKSAARAAIVATQGAPASPDVPALLLPLRQLGLAIQSRLPQRSSVAWCRSEESNPRSFLTNDGRGGPGTSKDVEAARRRRGANPEA